MLSAFLAVFLLVTPLEARIQSIAASFKGQVALFAHNMKTGQTVGLNQGQRMRTASVIKLPILVETFYQVREGKLRLDQRVSAQPPENRVGGSGILSELSPGLEITLEDALKLMIELSDNSATNVVLDLVTPQAVTARMASLGLPNTKSLNKTFRPLPNPTEENKTYGIGVTTPEEMVKLLEMIERREVVDAASCDKILAILKKQFYTEGMPRYLAGQKVDWALKTGALDNLRNDVGILYTEAGPIAMAIFCDRSPDRRWTVDNEATLAIAKLSKAVFDEWAGTAATRQAAAADYDVVISHAHIIDGAGNPWFPGDIGIKDGKIARIAPYGSLAASAAKRFIDAHNQVVAPGFIDIHTHSEEGLLRTATADNFVMDGVTSLISGNCGGSRTDLGDYFAQLEKNGISLNAGSLIGHNSVRAQVMKTENRQATPAEMEAMEKVVEKNMREGAVGFSTGLIYVPGTYANTEEVVDLARVAGRFGGIYASHIRSERSGVVDAINEAIAVGEKARMRVEISHFKIADERMWGQSSRTLQLVEDARRRGIEVTVDQYPYLASSTGLSTTLPSWALADGDEKVKQRLTDPATRKKIAAEILDFVKPHKHLDFIVIARARFDPSIEGKNITEITKLRNRKADLKNEIETVLDLQLKEIESKARVQIIKFIMSDKDVERIMRAPFTMVASDGGIVQMNSGVPHPRNYGTRSRVLALYVREKRTIGLEDAVRKMTSLPAQTFRMSGRGVLREGYWADVVVFDPDKVADKATYTKPHQYSVGFSYVLVNGEPVVAEGKQTGAKPGRILYGPGKANSD